MVTKKTIPASIKAALITGVLGLIGTLGVSLIPKKEEKPQQPPRHSEGSDIKNQEGIVIQTNGTTNISGGIHIDNSSKRTVVKSTRPIKLEVEQLNILRSNNGLAVLDYTIHNTSNINLCINKAIIKSQGAWSLFDFWLPPPYPKEITFDYQVDIPLVGATNEIDIHQEIPAGTTDRFTLSLGIGRIVQGPFLSKEFRLFSVELLYDKERRAISSDTIFVNVMPNVVYGNNFQSFHTPLKIAQEFSEKANAALAASKSAKTIDRKSVEALTDYIKAIQSYSIRLEQSRIK